MVSFQSYNERSHEKDNAYKGAQWYLADVNKVWLLQVHVELNKHPQHLIAELFVLHQGHADLQAISKKTTDIVLHTGKEKQSALIVMTKAFLEYSTMTKTVLVTIK